MNKSKHSIGRLSALLLVSSSFAANAAQVQFKAYDSRGVDTGTCIEKPAVSGVYVLKACNSQNPNQKFEFDVNGYGSTISQNYGQDCLVVTVGSSTQIGFGTGVISPRACNTNDPRVIDSEQWRWTDGTKIKVVGDDSLCLSANGLDYFPPRLVLGHCDFPTTLPQWDVMIVN